MRQLRRVEDAKATGRRVSSGYNLRSEVGVRYDSRAEWILKNERFRKADPVPLNS